MAAQTNLVAATQGRLLDPSMTLVTDPRLHPTLRDFILKIGPPMTLNAPPPADNLINGTATLKELSDSIKASHEGMRAFSEVIMKLAPVPEPSVDIAYEKREISGSDGNTIDLHIYRPAGNDILPSVIYIHGGGMVFLDLSFKLLHVWMKQLAARANVVVIGVEFRNAWSENGFQPFPAGLNDCASAVQWVQTHKAELNVNKIILNGESGGANLAIATALKANQEGWVNKIDGVYAAAPYISGIYHWTPEEQVKEGLASLVECNGYGFSIAGVQAALYESGGFEHPHATNPLAWPYHATDKFLTGLPPFVISADEVDPLRDEALVFHRKLGAAGVKSRAVVKVGLPHAAAQIYGGVVLDELYALIGDIKNFVYNL